MGRSTHASAPPHSLAHLDRVTCSVRCGPSSLSALGVCSIRSILDVRVGAATSDRPGGEASLGPARRERSNIVYSVAEHRRGKSCKISNTQTGARSCRHFHRLSGLAFSPRLTTLLPSNRTRATSVLSPDWCSLQSLSTFCKRLFSPTDYSLALLLPALFRLTKTPFPRRVLAPAAA